MTTWIKEHFDSVEHTKQTISAASIGASVLSMVLMVVWLLFSR